MGITVDLKRARTVLVESVALARSDAALPVEWLATTRAIDACPSKTFTPVLGTALLAKATDPRIDALSLKETSGNRAASAYSARSVAHEVLVPGAVEHGYFLRTTGREPLNNQPFFRYLRIDEITRIKGNAKSFLPRLIKACEEINRLDGDKAKLALAAFLRVRIRAGEDREQVDLRASQLSFVNTIETTEKFVIDFPEGGRRGQAFVAAAFDLAGHDVRSIRVNDPSRNMPGDVAIVRATEPVIAIEVRQKQVSFADTMHFAESLRQGAVPLGLIAMLSPDQARLDDVAVQAQAESDFGVALDCVYGVRKLLVTAFAWSGAPLESSLESFPKLFLYRLREIEVADATIAEWAELFE